MSAQVSLNNFFKSRLLKLPNYNCNCISFRFLNRLWKKVEQTDFPKSCIWLMQMLVFLFFALTLIWNRKNLVWLMAACRLSFLALDFPGELTLTDWLTQIVHMVVEIFVLIHFKKDPEESPKESPEESSKRISKRIFRRISLSIF